MIVVRGARPGAGSQRRSSTFTGEVWADQILPHTDGTTIATVFFAPGARTYWHRHEHGQILLVLAGQGLICAEGEPAALLRAGDTVWVPPGERHWHGAAPATVMTHTAISLGVTEWSDEVSGAEYASASGD